MCPGSFFVVDRVMESGANRGRQSGCQGVMVLGFGVGEVWVPSFCSYGLETMAERESREIQPHPAGRVGLPTALHQQHRTRGSP
jgi:hypothetical protein